MIYVIIFVFIIFSVGMDDLKCYQCADVGELTAEQLTALDAIFPGLSDLPPCDQPDIVTCSVYNKCYHADWKLLGKSEHVNHLTTIIFFFF